jgi:hypothetical protein
MLAHLGAYDVDRDKTLAVDVIPNGGFEELRGDRRRRIGHGQGGAGEREREAATGGSDQEATA